MPTWLGKKPHGGFKMTRPVLTSFGLLAAFALGFVVAALIWLTAGGGAWRSSVQVDEVWFNPTTEELEFIVQSCNGAPSVRVEQGDDLLEATVEAFSTLTGGDDCQDAVVLGIPPDARDRIPLAVVDGHSGNVIDVRTTESAPLESP